MEALVRGIHHFQTTRFSENKDLFKHLSEGQKPDTLLITCSDSRISPEMLLQTKPGDLFILRNAGNIIPAFGAAKGGEGATIEYAIKALGVSHIIVMGHSNCGAMKGLLHREDLGELPLVKEWLDNASATYEVVKECYGDLKDTDLLNATIKENVLVQIDNLRTHPVVASHLAKGELTLHGWIYQIETGTILAFDPNESHFSPITVQKVPVGVKTRYKLEKLASGEEKENSISPDDTSLIPDEAINS